MNKHEDYMRLAIDEALLSIQQGGGPFGAVVVQNGRVIAYGNNQVSLLNDPTAHAEMVAIRNAARVLGRFKLDDCEIYSSCEPCPMCLGAIYWSRIRKIYFGASKHDARNAGFDDEFFYSELAKDPADRTIPMIQVQHSDALKAFEAWDQLEDKIEY